MAIQFLTPGTILFGASGVAMDAACCCGDCCDFTARTLYLTIDNFTKDAGDTCDVNCVGFAVTALASIATTTNANASWISTFDGTPCYDTDPVVLIYSLQCDDAGAYGTAGDLYLEMSSSGSSFVIDGACAVICMIRLKDEGGAEPAEWQPLGTKVCDPFYVQATVNIVLKDAFAADCGTGTMRVTITE